MIKTIKIIINKKFETKPYGCRLIYVNRVNIIDIYRYYRLSIYKPPQTQYESKPSKRRD